MSRAKILLWSISILLVFHFGGLFEKFFEHPQGIHFMRQTDSLSFIIHYLKNGMDFFSPGVLSLNSFEGRAACEFPIFYYLSALLVKLGLTPSEALRVFGISSTLLGLFSLYSRAANFLNSSLLAIFFMFLCFSSTVWMYYSLSYIPDAISLGLCLFGIDRFIAFWKNDSQTKSLYLALLALTLASALKLTFAIYPIALASAYSFNKVINRTGEKKKLAKVIGLSILGGALASSWFFYADYYNKVNFDFYFLTQAAPYWKMTAEGIRIVWDHVTENWVSSYYYKPTRFFILLSVIVTILRWTKLSLQVQTTLALCTCGCILYFFLFFAQFKDHDYYFMVIAPLIFSFFLITLHQLRALSVQPSIKLVVSIAFVALAVLSMNHGLRKFNDRWGNRNDYFAAIGYQFDGIDNYLDELSIPDDSQVIIIPDKSPNGGLYFAQKKGWAIRDSSALDISKTLSLIAGGGVDYLLVTDSAFTEIPSFKPYLSEQVGSYEGCNIYRIP